MREDIEQRVAQHYAHGALEQSILTALKDAGKDPDHLSPADLAPVDEFHIGGRQATVEFAAQMDLERGASLLEVGCGLGGASRYFAHECGCQVTGIDLTEEYVQMAATLARRTGLHRSVSYPCASAMTMPFAPASFDGAYMLHVGMNIADKLAMFAEIRRVLKPRAVFGIYDVMRESEGELSYPVPWSSGPETSFVENAAAYRRMLEAAGFEVRKERTRREFAIEFFREMRARAAHSNGPSPLGLHILMGAASPRKVENMIGNLERGLLALTEFICRVK